MINLDSLFIYPIVLGLTTIIVISIYEYYTEYYTTPLSAISASVPEPESPTAAFVTDSITGVRPEPTIVSVICRYVFDL